MKDILLVSAFGRGHWLAARLAHEGFKVKLLDVSSSLGPWISEDREGPYGFFRDENLTELQTLRIEEEGYQDLVKPGFTLWLEKGPISFQTRESYYMIKQEGVSETALNYLKNYHTISRNEKENLIYDLQQEDFKKSWLVHLAHHLVSSTYHNSVNCLSYGRPMNIFEDFFIRRISRKDFLQNLSWLEKQGVEVIKQASIESIKISQQGISSFYVKSLGEQKALFYVWSLSSEETTLLSQKFVKKLFPQGVLFPQWVWKRYRLEFQQHKILKTFPLSFVLIKDIYCSWTHENLCWVQRTVVPEVYDVWVLIPHCRSQDFLYLQNIYKKIKNVFLNKIPDLKMSLVEEVAMARFPVFSSQSREQKTSLSPQNLFLDGPEFWDQLDWLGQMNYQTKILKKVIKKKGYLKDKGSR